MYYVCINVYYMKYYVRFLYQYLVYTYNVFT